MNPLTLISWSSRLQGWFCLLLLRICEHRRTPGRELVAVFDPNLVKDVAKVRRHVCIAGQARCDVSQAWKGDGSEVAGGKNDGALLSSGSGWHSAPAKLPPWTTKRELIGYTKSKENI